MPDSGAALKLLVTIVDRGKGRAAADIYRAARLQFDYVCMGTGTADSKILDYLGLAETEKDVVLTLAPAARLPGVIARVNERFRLTQPGRGILFTVPLSGVSGQAAQVLCMGPEEREKGGQPAMEAEERYDLIVAVVDRGYLDTVMDAARAGGARGGTALHARRVGCGEGESLLGFALQPEKEVVAILAPRSRKNGMMQAINRAAGLATEARGLLFSLPVDDMMGLRAPAEAADGTPPKG